MCWFSERRYTSLICGLPFSFLVVLPLFWGNFTVLWQAHSSASYPVSLWLLRAICVMVMFYMCYELIEHFRLTSTHNLEWLVGCDLLMKYEILAEGGNNNADCLTEMVTFHYILPNDVFFTYILMAVNTKGKRDGSLVNFVGTASFSRAFSIPGCVGGPGRRQRLIGKKFTTKGCCHWGGWVRGKDSWCLSCTLWLGAAKQKRHFRLFPLFFLSFAYFLPIYSFVYFSCLFVSVCPIQT